MLLHASNCVLCIPAEKGIGKLKQRLGLKKQGSKGVTNAPSSPIPTPGNPYPMAAGGHHPGKFSSQGHMPHSQPSSAQHSQRSHLDDPTHQGSAGLQDDQSGTAAAVAASEMAAQDPGRLSERRSAGQQEEEEQAMMELAIKVRLICSVTTASMSMQPVPQAAFGIETYIMHLQCMPLQDAVLGCTALQC